MCISCTEYTVLEKKIQRKNVGWNGSKYSKTAVEHNYFAVIILILSVACVRIASLYVC